MDNKEVIDLISAMNDYADKKNNQGLKNVLLITLIGVVGSGLAAIIGYGWREIMTLRDANSDLKDKIVRMEVKYDISVKEQNKVVFTMAETLAHACEVTETKPEPEAEPEKPSAVKPKKKPVMPDKLFDDDKFREYHKHFEQRIQENMPPQQIQQMER